MISGWNRFIYRNNVSNRMNMNINTGGYRSDKTYSSVYLYWKHSKKVSSVVIRRSFQCRNCGTFVEVTEPKDKRTTFCSQACREKWFSLHRNKNTLHVNLKRNSVDRRDIV